MSRSKGAGGDDTARIAGLYAARIAAGKAQLTAAMESHGLTHATGWRVHEELVGTPEAPSLRLRPIHPTQTAPKLLEVLVSLH